MKAAPLVAPGLPPGGTTALKAVREKLKFVRLRANETLPLKEPFKANCCVTVRLMLPVGALKSSRRSARNGAASGNPFCAGAVLIANARVSVSGADCTAIAE